MATPGLVQHSWWQSNENLETGNNFKYTLPNATLSGNLLVVVLSYAYSASRTVTVTDSSSTTWTSCGAATNDTVNGVTTQAFYRANAPSGITDITVTFNAALFGVQAAFSEWYNVATTSPIDGYHAANLVLTNSPNPSIASGSFTTTTAGDLILHYGINTDSGPTFGIATNIAAATGYTLIEADLHYGGFVEYQVQSSAGTTNPSAAITVPSQVSYNSLTVAFKSATAGTAPGTGIRIVGILHSRIDTSGTANYSVQMPNSGNLLCLTTAYADNQEKLNSISDTADGAWTVVRPSTGIAQFAYIPAATVSQTRKLTVNTTDLGSNNLQFLIYDIIGAAAAPYDTDAFNSGGAVSAGGTASAAPSITPSTSNGLVIATCGFFTGPPSSMPSPSGGTMDSMYYTGYTDLSPADSGDGYGHVYNSTATAQSFSWVDSHATTGWAAVAVAFKAASVGGATFTENLSISSSSAVSVARRAGKILPVSSSSVVSIARGAGKVLAVAAASAVSVVLTKVKIVALSVLSPSALSVIRAVGKPLPIASSSIVAASLQVAKPLPVIASRFSSRLNLGMERMLRVSPF
jgi:hypothetical protein